MDSGDIHYYGELMVAVGLFSARSSVSDWVTAAAGSVTRPTQFPLR